MSLYGYGLAKYVVESSLGVPTGCVGKLRWQTAAMAEPWDGVGKAAMAGTHKAKEGAFGWVRCSRWR
jgi:carboxylesterase type B